MNKRRLIPLFTAFVLWGSQYVVSKVALRTIPPVTLLALRYLVSIPALLLVLRLRRALKPVDRRDWPILFAIGFTGYFASFCLQMLGIDRLTGSLSSLLGAMNPIFIPILAALFLHERITLSKIACVALSMLGVVVIVGVGGTADDLTALVKVYHALGGDQGGTTTYEVRWYNTAEGKWETKNTIPRDKAPSTNGEANKVLILGSDEIWTQNAYYDGVEWTLHGLGFDTFEKVNSTTAYATATNGTIYKLNAERSGISDAWTQVDLGGKLLGSRYDGALAVKLTSGGFAILNADGTTAATYPEITPDIFGDVWTKDGAFKPQTNGVSPVETVGFGGDGNVYALVVGAGRNYVVRADGSEWTLLDTVEAFDVGGTNETEKRPAVPSRIASLGEGVSLLYGEKGSLYLHAQYFTVTFNSNGGSAVSPITGQAWSSFVMPIPTKSGMSFAGWYTDEGLTKLYTNPVIPAANLTLYAKWTETSTDRWAEDREKALKQLDNALERMDEGDYSNANWQRVLVEYENGKYAIAIADPQPESEDVSVINKAVQDTIYAALNTAIDRMNAIPVLVLPPIDVVVSMDAQTIGLGYMIKPTIVHTTKYTKASEVIRIGRKRNMAAFLAATTTSTPLSTSILANSTIKIAFLAARPIKVTKPIWK